MSELNKQGVPTKPRRPKNSEQRCSSTSELTPNSIWQCKWTLEHEGAHSFERIGWKDESLKPAWRTR